LFIAANLYNNEEILDHWTDQVSQLIAWVGASKVYVSIYENGRSTDRTKEMLGLYDQYLNESNIPHRIIMDITKKDETYRRVPMLAKLRNHALEPLLEQHPPPEKILFLNDIFFYASKAIQLINTKEGDYDAVCGMDFFGEFYDTFATREADERWVGSGKYPYFALEESRRLLYKEEPIPVYSCWNGIIALNAEPFLEVQRIEFRAIIPDEYEPVTEASECCLIHTDLRSLGYKRIYINPTVKVSKKT
ncbi:mannosyltransferase 1, partial [Spinellus fusiger]